MQEKIIQQDNTRLSMLSQNLPTQKSSNFFHNLTPKVINDQAHILFPITSFFIDQILGEKIESLFLLIFKGSLTFPLIMNAANHSQ